MNMLEGSIADKMVWFAIPLAATGICQQLFNAIDTLIMGQMVGKEAMAAVGSNAPIVGLLLSLFIGISLGSNVVIAHFMGERDKEGVDKAVHSSVLFAIICGIFLTIVGEFAAAPILDFLSVPDEIMGMALLYLRILFVGMPVILLYNFTAAIFRSIGDTRTPLSCLLISGIFKVIFSLVSVLFLGMTVDGVACSTVLGSTISSLLLLRLLVHTRLPIHVSLKKLHLDPAITKEILRIGVPAGIQGAVFSLSNVVIQGAINSLGTESMAASAAAFNIEIFVYYILNAFGQACTTFTGQNFGARQFDRCKKVLKVSLLLDFFATVIASGLVVYFAGPLLSIFTSDPEVIRLGTVRIDYVISGQVFDMIIEVFSGSMRGYGESLIPAVLSVVGICGSRLGYIWTVFPLHPDFATIMFVYPLSWIVTDIALVIVYFYFIKRLERKAADGEI